MRRGGAPSMALPRAKSSKLQSGNPCGVGRLERRLMAINGLFGVMRRASALPPKADIAIPAMDPYFRVCAKPWIPVHPMCATTSTKKPSSSEPHTEAQNPRIAEQKPRRTQGANPSAKTTPHPTDKPKPTNRSRQRRDQNQQTAQPRAQNHHSHYKFGTPLPGTSAPNISDLRHPKSVTCHPTYP